MDATLQPKQSIAPPSAKRAAPSSTAKLSAPAACSTSASVKELKAQTGHAVDEWPLSS